MLARHSVILMDWMRNRPRLEASQKHYWGNYFDPVSERYPQAADDHSPGQIIPRLMKLVYYRVYSNPPLSSNLSQLNPVNTLILFSCFHYLYLTMIKAINKTDCYSWMNNLPIATGGRTIMLSVAFNVRDAIRNDCSTLHVPWKTDKIHEEPKPQQPV
jgi:hypothetical protein